MQGSKVRRVWSVTLVGLLALGPSCIEQPDATTGVETQARLAPDEIDETGDPGEPGETSDADEADALVELAALLDEVHADLVAALAGDEPLDPVEPGCELEPIEPIDSVDLPGIGSFETLVPSTTFGNVNVPACAPPADPAAALDAEIKKAEELVKLRNDQLIFGTQQGFTAPEIAELKLKLAIAEALLGHLQAKKEEAAIAANAPDRKLKLAEVAAKRAELNLKVATAAKEAATAARDATKRLLGIATSPAQLLGAELRLSDALIADTNALAAAVAARLAVLAEKAPKP